MNTMRGESWIDAYVALLALGFPHERAMVLARELVG